MINEIHIGITFLNLRICNNSFIKEIEFGLEESFNLSYYHSLHLQTQVHCLSLGLIYVYWKGHPILDDK